LRSWKPTKSIGVGAAGKSWGAAHFTRVGA